MHKNRPCLGLIAATARPTAIPILPVKPVNVFCLSTCTLRLRFSLPPPTHHSALRENNPTILPHPTSPATNTGIWCAPVSVPIDVKGIGRKKSPIRIVTTRKPQHPSPKPQSPFALVRLKCSFPGQYTKTHTAGNRLNNASIAQLLRGEGNSPRFPVIACG